MSNRIVPILLLACSCSFGTAAPDENPAWSIGNARLGLLAQTSVVIGKTVKDHDARQVGQIEDVLLDVPAGEVLATLVSRGKKDPWMVVPAACYRGVSKEKAVLDTDRKIYENAPPVAKGAGFRDLNADTIRQSFRYFGKAPPALPDSGLGTLSCGRELLHARLLDKNGQPSAKVADAMLDVPVGRVVYLVVEPVAGGPLYVLPPVLVSRSQSGPDLVLEIPQARLLSGPHFDKDFWTDMAFPKMASDVASHYGFGSAEAPAQVAAAASKAPERSDSEITSAVQIELMRSARGRVPVTLAVTCLNGRVTLAGEVRDERQKEELTRAAERVVGAANVNALLKLPQKRAGL